MNTSPNISVIMAVYNSQEYLKDAIESVLNQSFKNFEFIIIDDGSTDKSIELIHSFQKTDNRIILIQNKENLGLPKSLNKGLDIVQGQYIARMDADDINDLCRFEKQYQYLEDHHDIDIIGCQLKILSKEGILTNETWQYSTSWKEINLATFFESPLPHPAIMARAAVFNKFKIRYNESFIVAQDYELWSRLIINHKISNHPEYLFNYRVLRKSINPIRTELTNEIRKTQLFTRLNITPTDNEWEIHQFIFGFNKSLNYKLNAKAVLCWLNKIACKIEENRISTKAEFYNYLKKKNYIEIQLRSHLRNNKSDLFKVLQIIWGIDKYVLQKRLKLTFKFFKDLLS